MDLSQLSFGLDFSGGSLGFYLGLVFGKLGLFWGPLTALLADLQQAVLAVPNDVRVNITDKAFVGSIHPFPRVSEAARVPYVHSAAPEAVNLDRVAFGTVEAPHSSAATLSAHNAVRRGACDLKRVPCVTHMSSLDPFLHLCDLQASPIAAFAQKNQACLVEHASRSLFAFHAELCRRRMH